MTVLSKEMKTKVVRYWFETKSWITVKRKLIRYNGLNYRDIPCRKSLENIVSKFSEHGEISDIRKGRVGRKKSSRTIENIERVAESVQNNPRLSCNRRSQELVLSKSSVYRILRRDLGFTPYLVQVKQALSQEDMTARRVMCQWFLDMMNEHPDWVKNIWFSDESHFHLHGAVNRKSNVFWGKEKPTFVSQRPLHSPRVTAWCAMNAQVVIGPYFFEDDAGDTANVNQQNYRAVLRQFIGSLRRRGKIMEEQWFQQDGATPHVANDTLELLKKEFAERVISRKTDCIWAPHSPDLNPCDFFLWGHVKSKIYANAHENLAQLRGEIRRVIRRVTPDMCAHTIQHFQQRVRLCLQRDGGHFEQLL